MADKCDVEACAHLGGVIGNTRRGGEKKRCDAVPSGMGHSWHVGDEAGAQGEVAGGRNVKRWRCGLIA